MGKTFKTLITNAGKWGWISDKIGYKYVKFHPITKKNGQKYLTSSTKYGINFQIMKNLRIAH